MTWVSDTVHGSVTLNAAAGGVRAGVLVLWCGVPLVWLVAQLILCTTAVPQLSLIEGGCQVGVGVCVGGGREGGEVWRKHSCS